LGQLAGCYALSPGYEIGLADDVVRVFVREVVEYENTIVRIVHHVDSAMPVHGNIAWTEQASGGDTAVVFDA